MKFPGLGAVPLEDGRCRFRVFAPGVQRIEVHLTSPEDRHIPGHSDMGNTCRTSGRHKDMAHFLLQCTGLFERL